MSDVESLLDALNKGLLPTAIVLIVIIITNLAKILEQIRLLLEQIRQWRTHDADHLRTIADDDKLDDGLKKLLNEKYRQQLFAKQVGITTDLDTRNALISLNSQYPTIATWTNLRRAYPYLRFENEALCVHKTWRDKLFKGLMTLVAVLIGLYAILVFVVAVFVQIETGEGLFTTGMIGLFFFAFALFISSLNWPYNSANKINQLLAQDTVEEHEKVEPTETDRCLITRLKVDCKKPLKWLLRRPD